jgi:hypothetical protein
MINMSIDVDDETRNFRCILFRFFFTRFFIIDFNETSKKQKKDFQFFNLFKELFTSSRQNEETSSSRKRELAFEIVCLQRFARREHHSFSFSLSFSFFFLLLALHFHLLSLFSFFFERIRAQLVFRANTIRNVDALFLLDERARIDRDVETKTFEKMSRNIINIFIDVSFRRSLKNVDL